jgi:ribonuclease HI
MTFIGLDPKALAASATWVVYCDGSAFPNPGHMGLGATICAPDGTQHELSIPAPGRGCNNEAEARAMMAALRHARHLGAANVLIHSDSRVVTDQLSGDGGAPIARLHPLFTELRGLLTAFDAVTVTWIPRHRNMAADALARAAAGLPPKSGQKKTLAG